MKKQDTTNTFGNGLVMDLNPSVTPNNVLTNCLNGTFVTYNGNENILQNDMGNARVETAYLPEGYVPLGTAQLGGIIYIVSYNPKEETCQIGSFPSPERNFFGESDASFLQNALIEPGDFIEERNDGKWPYIYPSNTESSNTEPYIVITNLTKSVLLNNNESELNPGDQFKIIASGLNKSLSDYFNKHYGDIRLKVNLLANNKSTDITSDLRSYKIKEGGVEGTYYICPQVGDQDEQEFNQNNSDSYRSVVSSGFNVLKTHNSGQLGITAEVETIDYYDISYYAEVYKNRNNDTGKETDNIKLVFTAEYPSGSKDLTGAALAYTLDDEKKFVLHNITNTEDDNEVINEEIASEKISFTIENLSKPEESKILRYCSIPKVNLGYLDHLKVEGEIDLSKINSGEIELTQWKYLVGKQTFTLNFGMNAYVEPQRQIKDVSFEFFELKEVLTNNSLSSLNGIKDQLNGDRSFTFLSDEVSDEVSEKPNFASPDYTFVLNKKSYSGYWNTVISYNDRILKDKCYIVRIKVNYEDDGDSKYNYRILYTSEQFNSAFAKEQDFGKLQLSKYLAIEDQSQSTITLKSHTQEFENDTVRYSNNSNSNDNNIIDIFNYNISVEKNITTNYGKDLFIVTSVNPRNPSVNYPSDIHPNIFTYNPISGEKALPNINIQHELNNTISTSLSTDLKFTVTTPLKIHYNDIQEPVILEKYLERLTINPDVYLLCCFGHKSQGHKIGLQLNDLVDEHLSQCYFKFRPGDDDRGTIYVSFPDLQDVYDTIIKEAANYDITIVPFTLSDFGSSKKDRRFLWNDDGHWVGHLHERGSMFKTFVCKNGNKYQLYNIERDFYNSDHENITDVQGLVKEMKKFFEDYYKLTPGDPTSTINMYKSNNVTYYDDYIMNCTLTWDFSTKYKLCINNIELSETSINNLNYQKNAVSITIPFVVKINMKDTINKVFIDVPLTGVKEEDNFTQYDLEDINYGSVYRKLGTDYTPVGEIEKTGVISNKSQITQTIKYPCKIQNNILTMNTGIPSKDNLGAHFYVDDEGIYLRVFK